MVDSESSDDTVEIARGAGFRLIQIPYREFGHGKTRQLALRSIGDAAHVVFMTQDAIPAADSSVAQLVSALSDPRVAVAYGRQLPLSDATAAASRLRAFNYPEASFIRSYEDRRSMGLRAAFNSNSFSAYRLAPLLQVGGFPVNAPVGEDILACAALLRAGYQCAYVAQAQVLHSHNYSHAQEFTRYRAIGEMHRLFPELLKEFGVAESEGVRFVLRELSQTKHEWHREWPGVALRAMTRYCGYRFGKWFSSRLS